MNEPDLKKELYEFTELFRTFDLLRGYRRKLGIGNDQLAIHLCEFYAIWSAFKIRRCLGSTDNVGTALDRDEGEICLDPGEMLPKYDAVHEAARNLLVAVSSGDTTAISGALEQMGVFALCPLPQQVFPEMDGVAARSSQRVQQVFLVDLALFAAEVGEYQRVRKYVHQARSLAPSSRELYNICVIEGLIALNEGSVSGAIRSLESSAQACQTDVDSSIQCSLLPPNLELAERLLELGEQTVVLSHLLECHNVWQLHRPQIEEWIHLIEGGARPDFKAAGTLEATGRLSRRLNVQWMRACSLEMQPSPTKPKTPMSSAQILAEREKRRAEYEPLFNAYIKRKLEYLESD